MNQESNPPNRGNLLYENLFERRDQDDSLKLISQGISVIIKNVHWLLEDAKILADRKRFARANFFLATAKEEIGKAYILIDMCRLDFLKHNANLKHLCKAFYDHVPKHAYYKTIFYFEVLNLNQFGVLMERVGINFQTELKRWFPSGDIGEPDMPHETYFDREANLYVDFLDDSQAWFAPDPETGEYEWGSEPEITNFSAIQKELEKLIKTEKKGLFKPDVLNILNQIFKKHYINEKTSRSDLFKFYEKFTKKVQTDLSISTEYPQNSALIVCPLYHFLNSDKKKGPRIELGGW